MTPADACLFIPASLRDSKLRLLEAIGRHMRKSGGRVIRHDVAALEAVPVGILPIVNCVPELADVVRRWRAVGRQFVYWDRGYARRINATCLPRGDNGGYYRWHVNAFQMRSIKNVPDDRWKVMRQELYPWNKGGRHIVIAAPTLTYSNFHGTHNWIAETIRQLAKLTDRQLVIRDKEHAIGRRPIQKDLEGAHCLVTHGSNSAVEAAILGCPVFVHESSAAALVGQTDLRKIEYPVYPDREPWVRSLAYSQFNERELMDGTLWRILEL